MEIDLCNWLSLITVLWFGHKLWALNTFGPIKGGLKRSKEMIKCLKEGTKEEKDKESRKFDLFN